MSEKDLQRNDYYNFSASRREERKKIGKVYTVDIDDEPVIFWRERERERE